MIEQSWKAELEAAIVRLADGWRVFASGCSQSSSQSFAYLDRDKDRRSIRIALSRDQFATAEARTSEVIRQLRDR